MVKGSDVVFNCFFGDSTMGLASEMTEWYRKEGKEYIVHNVSHSVTYKGKDEQGREQMYLSAIVTHSQP